MDPLKNRAIKEFNDLKKDTSVQVKILIMIFHWKRRIKGPIDTCYTGGIFDIDIGIQDDYPLSLQK